MTPSTRKGSAYPSSVVPVRRAGAGKRCDDHFVPATSPALLRRTHRSALPTRPTFPQARAGSASTELYLLAGPGSGEPAASQALGHQAWGPSHGLNTPAHAMPELSSCPVLPANGGIDCLQSGLGPTIYTDTPSQFSPLRPSLLTNCFVLLGFHLSSPLQTGQSSLVTVQWPTCLAQQVRARPCGSSTGFGPNISLS